MIAEVQDFAAEDFYFVSVGLGPAGFGVGEEGDGEDGLAVAATEVAEVVEHSGSKVGLGLGLVFEVDEQA